MAFNRKNWQDNVSDITAAELNRIEQGIYDNSLIADAVTNKLNPRDTETYKTAELTEGQITDVIGVNDIVIKGDTEQDGEPTPDSPVDVNVVSGSNVINTSNKNWLKLPVKSGTSNGVNYTIDEKGEIILNGTLTGNRVEVYPLSYALPNGTYTLSKKNHKVITFKRANGQNIFYINETTQSDTQTLTDEILVNLVILSTQGTVFNNEVIKLQLEQGSTATTYEPHQGKELSLDLPVENLFNPTLNSQTLSSGTVITKNSDNSYTMSKGSSTADLIILGTINVKEGEIYYLSDQRVGGANNISLRKGGSVLVTTETNPIVKYTSTATETLNVYARYQSTSDLIYKPMISTKYSKTYTPYGTDSIELCKIGDYQDYFYKSGSKWYLHKEMKRIKLDGSENWELRNNDGTNYCYSISSITDYMHGKLSNYGYSNMFVVGIAYGFDDALSRGKGLWFYSTSGSNVLYLVSTETSVANLKTWLASNNVTLYYVLETATNTEITDTTLTSQLEAIYNAPLYEETNITQENNDLPMVLDITACKDNINGIKAFIRK